MGFGKLNVSDCRFRLITARPKRESYGFKRNKLGFNTSSWSKSRVRSTRFCEIDGTFLCVSVNGHESLIVKGDFESILYLGRHGEIKQWFQASFTVEKHGQLHLQDMTSATEMTKKPEHDNDLAIRKLERPEDEDEDATITAHVDRNDKSRSNAPPVDSIAELEAAEAPLYDDTYPDGGYGYVVLFACVSIGACTAGSVSALGVYQAEYAERFPEKSSFQINLIGGFMGFVSRSLSGPVISLLIACARLVHGYW
jgi:hypothetical protein